MTELSLDKKIYNHIHENYLASIALAKSKLRIDGELKADLSPVINDPGFIKEADAVDFMFLEDRKKKALISKVTKWIREDLLPKDPEVSLPSTTIPWRELIPCIDLHDTSRLDYIMVDMTTGWISDVTFQAWTKAVPKEERDNYLGSCRHVTLKYNPYTLEKFIEKKDKGYSYLQLNTCVQPDWRYRSDKIGISPIFKEFYEGLFSNRESLEYASAWIYEAIYGRNATYLVLNGRKGIGKNILATACSKMVGIRNYTEAPRSALSKEFNTYLKDKRLVLMDEISFRDNKEKDKLKSYLNTFQAVEGKGKDAKMIELYCSILLSSNTDKDCNIEPDDRRFSVMDLTETPLLKRFGEDKVTELTEYIESEDFPLAFNSYLEETKLKDYNPNKPFIGETFKRLCLSSLKVWQIAIYEAITSKDRSRYCIKDLMTPDNERLFPSRFNDYANFLDNFTVDGKYLGHIEREQSVKTSVIIPSKDFLPEDGDDLE